MNDNFYVVLPSDNPGQYHHENKPSHYITKLNQPIELVGEWEVGLAEIDYDFARKDITPVHLGLEVTVFHGKKAVTKEKNLVYEDETTDLPYLFAQSELDDGNMFIKIPKSTEGIKSLDAKFSKKYPTLKNYIKFSYGISWLKIETIPFEYPKDSDRWHYIVPKENDPGWNELFYINIHRLQDWRWYVRPETDTMLIRKDLNRNEKVQYGNREIDSINGRKSYVFIANDNEWGSNLASRTNLTDNQSSLAYLNNNKNSALGAGAIYVDGFLNSLFARRIEESTYVTDSYFNTVPRRTIFGISEEPIEHFSELKSRWTFAKRKLWDKNDASDMFMIYTDIVEPSLVSTKEAPILRVIPYDNYLHATSHHYTEFNPIIYKKVNKARIDDISILFADTVGQFVKFHSRVRIVLHFKKING